MEQFKVEKLKSWLSEYVLKFKEKGMEDKATEYSCLRTAIEFAEGNEALNMVSHLYNIRNDIQTHIDAQNFDKAYKNLNGKLVYQMDKMLGKICALDFSDTMNPNDVSRMFIFKSDIDFWKNDILSRMQGVA